MIYNIHLNLSQSASDSYELNSREIQKCHSNSLFFPFYAIIAIYITYLMTCCYNYHFPQFLFFLKSLEEEQRNRHIYQICYSNLLFIICFFFFFIFSCRFELPSGVDDFQYCPLPQPQGCTKTRIYLLLQFFPKHVVSTRPYSAIDGGRTAETCCLNYGGQRKSCMLGITATSNPTSGI